MYKRAVARASLIALGFAVMTGTALAQRPPPQGQAAPQMSIERAWNWLIARPGVIIAILVIIGLIAYMFITRKKPTT